MKLFQEYIQPSTVEEALSALHTSSKPVCVIAGGTDLILDIRQERRSPVHTLIDVSAIPEMCKLDIRGNYIYIGAAVSLAKISEDQLIERNVQALVEACKLIGGPQVRNVATLGGNIAHALPAADGSIALMCYHTRVTIASLSKIREVSLDKMFLGPGKSSLDEGREIIVGFSIPLKKPGQSSAFKRVMNPQGIALPILNMSIWVEREDNILRDIRIAVGPSQGIPGRLELVEDHFKGTEIIDSTIEISEKVVSIFEQIPFRTSKHRSSAKYRHHLVKELFIDTFQLAWDRAENSLKESNDK